MVYFQVRVEHQSAVLVGVGERDGDEGFGIGFGGAEDGIVSEEVFLGGDKQAGRGVDRKLAQRFRAFLVGEAQTNFLG